MKMMMSNILLVIVLGLGFIASKNALAASVSGKVNFVGTVKEYTASNEGLHAQLRIRVSDSTCKSGSNQTGQPTERWITIKSGRMDGQFAHNSANFRNAFSLLMAAFLSGKSVQIDGVPNCNAGNTISLWSSQVGMY